MCQIMVPCRRPIIIADRHLCDSLVTVSALFAVVAAAAWAALSSIELDVLSAYLALSRSGGHRRIAVITGTLWCSGRGGGHGGGRGRTEEGRGRKETEASYNTLPPRGGLADPPSYCSSLVSSNREANGSKATRVLRCFAVFGLRGLRRVLGPPETIEDEEQVIWHPPGPNLPSPARPLSALDPIIAATLPSRWHALAL